MATLDEVAGSLKRTDELTLKPLSDDEVNAAIKLRLRAEDIKTMSSPEKLNDLTTMCSPIKSK